jgi:hypothetical protein
MVANLPSTAMVQKSQSYGGGKMLRPGLKTSAKKAVS